MRSTSKRTRIASAASPHADPRDVSGQIVAALSVASAEQYMSETRMHGLIHNVQETANEISCALGFTGKVAESPRRKSSGGNKKQVR